MKKFIYKGTTPIQLEFSVDKEVIVGKSELKAESPLKELGAKEGDIVQVTYTKAVAMTFEGVYELDESNQRVKTMTAKKLLVEAAEEKVTETATT